MGLYLPDHFAAAPLADTVDHFFIGQNAFARGAPVDGHFFLVSEAVLEQLEKNPLRPFVVVRIGGVDFTRPVKGNTERLKLLFKSCDIFLRHFRRMYVVFNGEVFCGQTKRVPANRIQDIVALKAAFARDNINRRIGTRVAYV